ncbi:ImmA/IrrE family metallo-endopeptidase [Bifidobacterium saimiriisciurei]|uniref:ImmA/IrrE family metallo-endopeptidase n=1 Tax=Bifidobacterium saimiriisciurei TaxID=2661627 RepID=A0ABX0CJ95_9BIFI|nr:ImmA/IrrE family metallo-endopeptidase [Bifidobacterium saimiriisciurei]NEH12440.1 ImmA/IrrE family metallo-endopeptidase [Bifidobacterium saimiriisciurei]
MGIDDLMHEAERRHVRVEERALRPGLCGLYYDPARLVIIDPRLSPSQYRCTLCHELVHAEYGDTCEPGGMGRTERRARRQTALRLIDPADYAMAERVYEGDVCRMAIELDVPVQTVLDYQQILRDRGQTTKSPVAR